MARREEFISLPAFPGLAVKEVKLAKGYEFGKPRGGKVDIFKKGTSRRAKQGVATLECVCSGLGSGSCDITVVGGLALCVNDTCTSCTWKVKVPTEAFGAYLAEAFQRKQIG